jgi:serine/threonine-protein kinase
MAQDTERLARHMEECSRCAEAVDQLLDREGLVAALRGQPAPSVQADETTVRNLVTRLCGLRPEASLTKDLWERTDLASTAARPELPAEGVAEWVGLLAPPREPDEIGRLGPYGILRLLGSGGMGAVFAARQAHPRRVVALKVLQVGPRAGRQQLARFHGETEVIARLQHPNIVQVYEVGEHEGLPYFTMEHIAGGSLAGRLAAAPMPARDAAELAQTLARAVHFAHGKGFVHRDLKPANVLLADGGTPKIADFGLAKQLGGDAGGPASPYRTESGAILGTPAYMAPEQAAGGKDVGPAADVYALGAILYECLTGRPPFRAPTVLETLEQVRTEEPVPISRLQPKTPRDLQTICLKCLAKDPARRYGSAAALADDLARFLHGEPIVARPVSSLERMRKWARRKPALAALLAVCGLLLAALLAGGLAYNARLRAALTEAEDSAAEARQQRSRADAGYLAARDALDRMLRHLEQRRLGAVPQLKEVQRELCKDALAFYQGVLAWADDPDPEIRLDAAHAYRRTATIQAFLSGAPDALRTYAQAIDLIEALPAAQRGRPETQELLAVCYGDRGLLSSRLADRERDVGRSLEIKERLAQEKPDDAGRHNSLAVAEHQLGQVLINASRWADAEIHCARAVLIRERLVHEHPQEEGYQEALAADYVNLALVYRATRRGAKGYVVHEKLEALLQPLIARHPEDVGHQLTLAAAESNWGDHLGGKGLRQAAVARCTKAIQLAEAALRREPNHYMARAITRNAHGVRAQNYEALGRWAEAAGDWDRVVELDDQPTSWINRVFRALARARAGKHASAVAEAQALVGLPEVSADGIWELARVYVLSIQAARSDAGLSTAEQDALAGRYAALAVALLQRLQGQGFFKDAAHAEWLSTDPDWQPLRGREDFRKLRAAVTEKKQG